MWICLVKDTPMAFAGILNFLLCEGVSSAQRRHYKKSVNIGLPKNQQIYICDRQTYNKFISF
jgi:hypothetical protein